MSIREIEGRKGRDSPPTGAAAFYGSTLSKGGKQGGISRIELIEGTK